jgi:hypothetical protein
MGQVIEKTEVGGQVIIKHIRKGKILRHEAVRDKSRNPDGYELLEGDPRLKKEGK